MTPGARRLRTQRGSAAVEFAIILPVLMLLVFGIMEWGYYFFLETTVVNAAREGARAGSVATSDVAVSRAEAAVDAALESGVLDPDQAGKDVQLTADSVTVTVTYPAGTLTGITFIPIPANAFGRAEMRR